MGALRSAASLGLHALLSPSADTDARCQRSVASQRQAPPETTARPAAYGGQGDGASLPGDRGPEPANPGSFAPSLAGGGEFKRSPARRGRASARAGATLALIRVNDAIDVRDLLSRVVFPTLVLHLAADPPGKVEPGCGFALPVANDVELRGGDKVWWTGSVDALSDEIEAFLTGSRERPEPERVLATVLFTDIVDATQRAAEMGDRAWKELLRNHHFLVRQQLEAHGGREIDTAGDGFLASFDRPARAVRCARAIADAVQELNIRIRAGVHTGECDVMGEKLSGIALHIGARVMSSAMPGEVLVSGTVRDLVVGSGLRFESRGVHSLKGIPGEWHLHAAIH